MHPEDQPLDPCCHLANIVEDNTDKISFAYDIMNRAMSRFAKLLWHFLQYNAVHSAVLISGILSFGLIFDSS